MSLRSAFTPLRHVLVIGENESLPTLVEETNRFCPGVAFTVLVQGRDRARLLARQLKERWGSELEEDASDLLRSRASLKGDRQVAVHGAEDDLMYSLTSDPRLAACCFDAAVFLADNVAPDPDAQNLLWLFKLLELVDHRRITVAPHFHTLAEILSSTKGDLVEQRTATAQGRQVRALSTQKLRTYFMAHCCFVPHLHRVYDELVTPTRVAFCQVEIDPLPTPIPFGQLLDALAAQGMILIGLDNGSNAVGSAPLVVNPLPASGQDVVDPRRIRRLYVLGTWA